MHRRDKHTRMNVVNAGLLRAILGPRLSFGCVQDIWRLRRGGRGRDLDGRRGQAIGRDRAGTHSAGFHRESHYTAKTGLVFARRLLGPISTPNLDSSTHHSATDIQ